MPANDFAMIGVTCEDCGRTYELRDFLGEPDSHGSKPLQCPHCYALLGRTEQGDSDRITRHRRGF